MTGDSLNLVGLLIVIVFLIFYKIVAVYSSYKKRQEINDNILSFFVNVIQSSGPKCHDAKLLLQLSKSLGDRELYKLMKMSIEVEKKYRKEDIHI